MEQNFNPGLTLINLSGTGPRILWPNGGCIKGLPLYFQICYEEGNDIVVFVNYTDLFKAFVDAEYQS